MRLKQVTVQRFRNVVEPQTIDVEDDVTVLVGKNESGKTTILEALHHLNPANRRDLKFDLVTEYPRWRLSPDRRKQGNLENVKPISAVFVLDEQDVADLSEALPAPPPVGAYCDASKSYANELYPSLRADLPTILRKAAEISELPGGDLEPLLGSDSLDAAITQARETAKDLKADPDKTLQSKGLTAFATAAAKYQYLVGKEQIEQDAINAVAAQLPRFFYFSTYQNLPGEADLTALAEKVAGEVVLSSEEETVVALLAHANVKPGDFLDVNYDSRKAELQAASLDLSSHAFEYWTQNKDLKVIFDTDNVEVGRDGDDHPIMHRLLKIELRDGRHGDVETNFATRSTGFRWFFSFFAAFSAYQESEDKIIVLLDEPGTSLHGEAQKDFIRFVAEELGQTKQTLYTTHSQFMIDPGQYEKLRAVQDRATRENPDLGVVVTKISLSGDRDTILPVESALGYSMSQHLFLGGGHHLLVEGSSDFIYIQRFTEQFLSSGKTGLDPRLAMLPVGGVTNMPAFVALLGRRLDVSALVDGSKSGNRFGRIKSAAEANDVPLSALVAVDDVGDPDMPKGSDIEDLFALADYLRLYNWAFGKSLKEADLPATTQPIVSRVTEVEGEFDHALPAHALTENRVEFFESVDSKTMARFEALVALLNATLT